MDSSDSDDISDLDNIQVDPYGAVPVGWRSKIHRYTVCGFCAPCGLGVHRLRVKIQYDNSVGCTTRMYAHTLCDFVDQE